MIQKKIVGNKEKAIGLTLSLKRKKTSRKSLD